MLLLRVDIAHINRVVMY